MTNTLRFLRIIWAALLTAIVLYICVGELIGRRNYPANITLFKAIAVLTIIVVCAIFAVRQFMAKQLTVLQAEPESAGVMAWWRGACIIGFALCDMVALYGFVLRIMGFTLTQVSPFYLGGIALMLLFVPRRPDSLDVTAS